MCLLVESGRVTAAIGGDGKFEESTMLVRYTELLHWLVTPAVAVSFMVAGKEDCGKAPVIALR